jgi:hypothetical protein
MDVPQIKQIMGYVHKKKQRADEQQNKPAGLQRALV